MSGRPSRLAALGVLAGMTTLLQLGPVYWPGGGYLLAMAATLPAAVASALLPRRCTWFYLGVCLLLGFLAQAEMFIYLTMTGPLGLMLGLFADRPAWQSIPAAAGALAGGMLLLPHLAGVYPFGGLEAGWSLAVQAAAFALFALVYAAIWHHVLRRVLVRLPFSPVYWKK